MGFGTVREIEFAENERRDVLLIERGPTRFEIEEQILEELDGDVLCRALFGIETLFAGRFIVRFLLEAVGETALEFFELEDRRRGNIDSTGVVWRRVRRERMAPKPSQP